MLNSEHLSLRILIMTQIVSRLYDYLGREQILVNRYLKAKISLPDLILK